MQVMLATLAGKFAKLTRSQRWLEALQVWKQLQEVESVDRRGTTQTTFVFVIFVFSCCFFCSNLLNPGCFARLVWACSSLITACGTAKHWPISLHLLSEAWV